MEPDHDTQAAVKPNATPVREAPRSMTRQQAHAAIVGKLPGRGKAARKAKRALAVHLIKQAVRRERQRRAG